MILFNTRQTSHGSEWSDKPGWYYRLLDFCSIGRLKFCRSGQQCILLGYWIQIALAQNFVQEVGLLFKNKDKSKVPPCKSGGRQKNLVNKNIFMHSLDPCDYGHEMYLRFLNSKWEGWRKNLGGLEKELTDIIGSIGPSGWRLYGTRLSTYPVSVPRRPSAHLPR